MQKQRKQKQERGKREKVTNSFGAFFLSHLGGTFPLENP